MLTRLTLRNFKRFKSAEIELGKSVVFIGPNNSGKTTALQALALWEVALRSWLAKRGGKASPEKRPGVAVNRRDLIAVPVPAANLLWRALHTRNVQSVEGKQRTRNIRVDVIVEGVTADRAWKCGFEFDYQNEESFVCRPVRQPGYEDVQIKDAKFSEVPEEVDSVRVAYLPPMSGLADREFIKQPGEIGFLIGQGQTAGVLRNLCHQIYSDEDKSGWEAMVRHVRNLFGVRLNPPKYIAERSEILMDYEERGDGQAAMTLDLSSAGRGLQQTLLLLAHLHANPQTVLLLDEPDAHLEILRQRQTFRLITEIAEQQGAQIISASHSEVVLEEAAGRGKVVAFVGQPHTLNDRGNQVVKSLTDIGWDQYYQAEAVGWMMFLEGPTDLAILQAFANTLAHPAAALLERPFVHYVSTNIPQKARDLFYGLREARAGLVGIAIFDRIQTLLKEDTPLREMMWSRREVENYFCSEDVLMAYARGQRTYDLFEQAESTRRETAMRDAIGEVAAALETLGHPDPWSPDIKATDEFLDPLFRKFFQTLKLPITFRKADYYQLAKLVPAGAIDNEIVRKLDAIVEVASNAKTNA
jgi:ABC-type lipoprotein export system ATPase subunit